MSDDIVASFPGVAGQPLAMALMCTPLIELGRPEDAYRMGRAALAAAPEDMAVRALVGNALAAGVPAFHLGMLRDGSRNACYAAAIERLVRPGMRVLEIGTGAGLLALLAARAGAEVVTCESNPVIAAAARQVIADNGFADRIRVVAKRSTAMSIGIDLPDRCDLLVSEVFGDDLFDEGVVASVADARVRLLHPGAAIVPPRAELRCALVVHERWRRMPLDTVLGFDLSAFAPLTRPRRSLPHRASADVALRSPSVGALAVDFAGAPIATPGERVTLTASGGRVDGVAHWLRLDFGDDVLYENEPFVATDAHWAVPVHAFAEPIHTLPGQQIEIEVRVFGTRLTIKAASDRPAHTARPAGSKPGT